MDAADTKGRTIVNPTIKDEVTFETTAEESGGEVTVLDIKLMPEGENALHYHKNHDETFTAKEGNLGLKLGKDDTKILQPGQSHTVKAGEVHAFYNPGSKPIVFRVELRPGSEGFENALRIIYGLARDGYANDKGVVKGLTNNALLAEMSDMSLPGVIFKILTPLLKFLAARGRKNGRLDELLDTYCR